MSSEHVEITAYIIHLHTTISICGIPYSTNASTDSDEYSKHTDIRAANQIPLIKLCDSPDWLALNMADAARVKKKTDKRKLNEGQGELKPETEM